LSSNFKDIAVIAYMFVNGGGEIKVES
jgi:hypothetical protein